MDCLEVWREGAVGTHLTNRDVLIASDIRHFTNNMSCFLFGTVYYNGIIPTIAQAASFTYLLAVTSGYLGLLISYVSFLSVTVLNSILGSWVASAGYELETQNGFFQYANTFLRYHAEHVAFYKGQEQERHKMEDLFEKAQQSMNPFINRSFFLNCKCLVSLA